MAEILNIPTEVWESNWKDDVDVDYAIYGDSEEAEKEYVNKEKTTDDIDEIKAQKLIMSWKKHHRIAESKAA